ncbi:MAG: RNA-binding S4 domain-containing protein [Calditrichaeota bacterium]|nr:MAG: RNA-binding S4 domain-containing protein [Calditrichota bacterium]
MEPVSDIITTQRIDKWLNFCCLYKTRSQATRACDERRIKVNGQVAKSSKLIKVGDVVTIKSESGKFFDIKILGITERNIPHQLARELYERDEPELSEEAKELLQLFKESSKGHKPKFKGRPTKKERRNLDKLKEIIKY